MKGTNIDDYSRFDRVDTTYALERYAKNDGISVAKLSLAASALPIPFLVNFSIASRIVSTHACRTFVLKSMGRLAPQDEKMVQDLYNANFIQPFNKIALGIRSVVIVSLSLLALSGLKELGTNTLIQSKVIQSVRGVILADVAQSLLYATITALALSTLFGFGFYAALAVALAGASLCLLDTSVRLYLAFFAPDDRINQFKLDEIVLKDIKNRLGPMTPVDHDLRLFIEQKIALVADLETQKEVVKEVFNGQEPKFTTNLLVPAPVLDAYPRSLSKMPG